LIAEEWLVDEAALLAASIEGRRRARPVVVVAGALPDEESLTAAPSRC
jgi:hypothetical protein